MNLTLPLVEDEGDEGWVMVNLPRRRGIMGD